MSRRRAIVLCGFSPAEDGCSRLSADRPSFRDHAAEQTEPPHAVGEAALAHVVRKQAEAAYVRSDLFEKRRVLMQSWSDYLPA